MTRRGYIVAVVLQRLIDRFNLRGGEDAHKWVMAARLPNGMAAFHEVEDECGQHEIARFYTECDPFPLLGDAIQVALPVPAADNLKPGGVVRFNRQPFRKIEHGKQP